MEDINCTVMPDCYRSMEGQHLARLRFREGDFVETSERLIFDVKGLIHPPNRIVAFVRYFPDKKGSRERGRYTYGKVYSFSDRYKLLKEKYPEYLVHDPMFDETICEVPVDHVKQLYDPIVKLRLLENNRDLDPLESKALRLAAFLKERSNVPKDEIGVTGSILVGLNNGNSDIDVVVYGSTNCRKVNMVLKQLLIDLNSPFEAYSSNDLKRLFDFRSKDTAISFENFLRTESKKAFQGKFMNTDYFVRFVKDWNESNEKYGDVQYKALGQAKVKATVTDDSESIFTPCRYQLENAKFVNRRKSCPVAEIVSFRGRFCEQAKSGEHVEAHGKVEKVTHLKTNEAHFRLLIGNNSSDYMVPV
jgi:predicted nucleotidyltransferase